MGASLQAGRAFGLVLVFRCLATRKRQRRWDIKIDLEILKQEQNRYAVKSYYFRVAGDSFRMQN
jgi:hypothetical protein